MPLPLDDNPDIAYLERLRDVVVLAEEDFRAALRRASAQPGSRPDNQIPPPQRVDEETWLRALAIAGAANDPGTRGLLADYAADGATTPFSGALFAVGRDPQFDATTRRVQLTDYQIVSVTLSGTASWVGGHASLAIDVGAVGERGRCCGPSVMCLEDATVIPPQPAPDPWGGDDPPTSLTPRPMPRPVGPRIIPHWGTIGISPVETGASIARRRAGLPVISAVTYFPSPDPAPGGIPGGLIRYCTRVSDPSCTAVKPVCDPGDIGFTADVGGLGQLGAGSTPCLPATGGVVFGRDVPETCQHVMSADALPAACGGWCESCGVPWEERNALARLCAAVDPAQGGGSPCERRPPGYQELHNRELQIQVGWQSGRATTQCTPTGRDGHESCVSCDEEGNCQESARTPSVDPAVAARGETLVDTPIGDMIHIPIAKTPVQRPPSKPAQPPATPAPPPAAAPAPATPPAPQPTTPPKPASTPAQAPGQKETPPPPQTTTKITPHTGPTEREFAHGPIREPGLGDPVELGDGALRLDHVDLSFDAPTRPLAFLRSYTSSSRQRSLLGSNWLFNWDVRLIPVTPGNTPPFLSPWSTGLPGQPTAVVLHDGDGTVQLFHLDVASRLFLPPAGSTDTLARTTDGGWAIRTADGRVRSFNTEGYLIEDRDRCGAGFTVEYEPTPLFALYRAFSDREALEQRGVPFDPYRLRLLAYLTGLGGRPDPVRERWRVTELDFPLRRIRDNVEREALTLARAYLLYLVGARGGRLPESVDGGHRLRPTVVTDDLGRTLEFSYYDPARSLSRAGWQFADHPETGLLAEVRGPAGTRVRFGYARPDGYPHELNEAFLVRAERADQPGVAPDIEPTAVRTLAFVYQWPAPARAAGTAPPSYDAWTDGVFAANRRYYETFVGCSYRDIERCRSGAVHTGVLRLAPGDPVELARDAVNGYISDIADNLISITNAGEIETETRYQPDPWQVDFDRVVAQRYGSSTAAQDPAAIGPDDQARTWQTGLPRAEMTFAQSGPRPGGGDLTDAFLPAALRIRYPLETEPQRPPRPTAPPAQTATGPAGWGGCDYAAMDLRRRELPGWVDQLEYFDVAETERLPHPARALRRTRLTPAQLVATQVGDPTSNDLVSTVYPTSASGLSPVRRVIGRRRELAANANRLCAWVRLVDRDGVVTYYGLNFKGQPLVQAIRRRSGDYVVTERVVNADGRAVQDRRPTTAPGSWTPAAGSTLYQYDEIDPRDDAGWDEWLPAFWARRANLLHVEQQVDGVQEENETTGTFVRGGGRFARHAYDPLFNQLVLTTEGAIELRPQAGGGTQRIEVPHRITAAVLDYQELTLDAPATDSRSIVPLLRALEPWGFHWLRTPAGDLDRTLVGAWQLPITLFDQDLNSDGARGNRFATTAARRGVGLPVATFTGPPDGDLLENRTQWSPHGQPTRIDGPGGEIDAFEYYPATAAFGRATAPADGDVSGGYAGTLARHTHRRFRARYPAQNGPPDPPCQALAGPYQWLLPVGTPSAAVPAALASLGLPSAVVDDILETSDPTSEAAVAVTAYSSAVTGQHRRVFTPYGTSIITRDTDGRPTVAVDVDGTRTECRYDARGAVTSIRRFDAAGSQIGETAFTYDAAGNRLSACRALSAGGCATASGAAIRTSWSYTGGDQIWRYTDGAGLVTTFRYDERNLAAGVVLTAPGPAPQRQRGIAFERDLDGHVTRARHGALTDADGGVLDERYAYDALGRLVGWVDIRGIPWQQAWSSRDLLSRMRQSATVYPAAPAVPSPLEILRGYDAYGHLVRETRNGILARELRFDAAGRVVTARTAGHGTEYATHDADGREIWRRSADGRVLIATARDTPHRRSTTTLRKDAAGATHAEMILRALDAHGRPLTEARVAGGIEIARTAIYGPDGLLRTETDALGHTITYERNWVGWPVRLIEPRGDSAGADETAIRYDGAGRPRFVTDPAGNQSEYAYNGFGDLERVAHPGLPPVVFTFSYDMLGRLLRHAMGPDVVRIDRDGRGDPVSEVLELPSGEEPFIGRTFDELGRATLTRHLNPALDWLDRRSRAVTCANRYDPLGWVAFEEITVGLEAGASRNDAWTVNNGAWTRSTQIMRPGAQRDWTETFDRGGRLVAKSDASSVFTAEFSWVADWYSGRTQGQPNRPSPLREEVERDPFGLAAAVRYTAIDLDAAGLPLDSAEGADYCIGPWDTACTAPLLDIVLARDPLGRAGIIEQRVGQPRVDGGTRIAGPRPSSWRGYAYTPRHHLAATWEDAPLTPAAPAPDPYGATAGEVAARAGAATQWAYDREAAVGGVREISRPGTTSSRWRLAVPRGPGHELVSVEVDRRTLSSSHDSAGRIVASGDRAFAYHPDGALAVIRDQGNLTEAYAYTADGRLAARWLAATAAPDETYAYDGRHQVAATGPADGPRWEAVWGAGQDHLLAWTDLTGPDLERIPLLDPRGSVVAVWAPRSARLAGVLEEDPEGRRTVYAANGDVACAETGTGDVCATPGGVPFGLTGGWRSDRTGLIWRGARWYAPQLGQWLTRDPAGMVDGLNPYAYARSDPINRTDTTGLASTGPAASPSRHTAPNGPPHPPLRPSSATPRRTPARSNRLPPMPTARLFSLPGSALPPGIPGGPPTPPSPFRGGFLDLLGWAYGPDVYSRGLNGGVSARDFHPVLAGVLVGVLTFLPEPPAASLHTGRWQSDVPPKFGLRSEIFGPPGVDTYGAWAEGFLARVDIKPGVPEPRATPSSLGIGRDDVHHHRSAYGWSNLGFDAAASAAGGVAITNDMIQAGVGAGVGAALSAHTRNRYLRLGLSVGPSWLIRLHNSDDDADGDREYGFGIDVGPISADYKTESPVSDLPWILMFGAPAVMVAEMLGDDIADALQDSR